MSSRHLLEAAGCLATTAASYAWGCAGAGTGDGGRTLAWALAAATTTWMAMATRLWWLAAAAARESRAVTPHRPDAGRWTRPSPR